MQNILHKLSAIKFPRVRNHIGIYTLPTTIRSNTRSSASHYAAPSGSPGQIAVVILLIMAVLLVLGLSLAARTSQEIQLTGQEQDSTRVFNAAETGVEKALSESSNFTDAEAAGSKIINLDSAELPTGIGTDVTITKQTGLTTYVNEGTSATVHLNNATGYIDIDWAKEGTCNARAALVIALYYNDGADKVQYYPIKPNCIGYSDGGKATGFQDSAGGSGGYNHRYRLDLTGISNPAMARIKPLYAGTDLNVVGANLTQAFDIRSEAYENTTGQTTVEKSAIQVTRTKPAPPTVLEYALYSGNLLEKTTN